MGSERLVRPAGPVSGADGTHEPVVVVADDPPAAGRLVAEVIRGVVRASPRCRLGLATGSTPRPAYRELVAAHAGDRDAFARVTALLLDEYVGLSPDDPRSYRATIRRELTDGLGIPPAQVLGPAIGDDPAAACAAYEAVVRARGGVDLQLLGIGRNGHVGFNEPGTPFDAPTHVVALTPTTRADNARFFDRPEDVPTHAVTQGIGTILRADRLLLAATGGAKAPAVAAALEGPVDPACPASALRRHPRVTVVLDRDAAAGLRRSGRSAG